MFEKILAWSKLTLKQRFNFLMGLQLAVLGSVIVTLWGMVGEKQKEKNELRIEIAAKEAAMEARLDICNQQYLLYLQKSEMEYRELLFQAKQLKNNTDEDN